MSPRTIILTIEGGFFKSISAYQHTAVQWKERQAEGKEKCTPVQAHLIIREYLGQISQLLKFNNNTMTSFNHQFTVEGEEEGQKGKDDESKRTMEGDDAKEKGD